MPPEDSRSSERLLREVINGYRRYPALLRLAYRGSLYTLARRFAARGASRQLIEEMLTEQSLVNRIYSPTSESDHIRAQREWSSYTLTNSVGPAGTSLLGVAHREVVSILVDALAKRMDLVPVAPLPSTLRLGGIDLVIDPSSDVAERLPGPSHLRLQWVIGPALEFGLDRCFGAELIDPLITLFPDGAMTYLTDGEFGLVDSRRLQSAMDFFSQIGEFASRESGRRQFCDVDSEVRRWLLALSS